MITQKEISSISQKIAEKLSPVKIILFGSYAYGKPNENSDLDICVIEEKFKSKQAEKKKIRELLGNISFGLDILVPEKEEYEFYKNEINSVYYDIDKNGKVLWERNS